jgi:hypothetical protein
MLREELRQLERTRDTKTNDSAGREADNRAIPEVDLPRLRPEIAGGHVNEGCLPGAIWADDGEVLARVHVEIDSVGCLDTPEGQAQPARR